jgi:hypothetical protein
MARKFSLTNYGEIVGRPSVVVVVTTVSMTSVVRDIGVEKAFASESGAPCSLVVFIESTVQMASM